jgi:hypothetical protein
MREPWHVAVWWVVSGIVMWSGSGLIYWWLSRNDPAGSDPALVFLFFTLVLGMCGTGIAHSILIAWWRGGGWAWLLSSMIGLVLGGIMLIVGLFIFHGGGPESIEAILFGSIHGGIGIIIGGMQWLVVVRRWRRELWWWAIAGGIGWAAAWVVLFGIPPLPVHAVFRPIPETGLFFGGIGTIHALVTGAAMYRIAITLQHPMPVPTT